MNWKFFHPIFEYKRKFNDYNLPWTGHAFFAYDLVRNMKPQKIVELGTFKGTSLYSFAQAAKDGSLDTEIYAIDTWEGDENAGYFGNEVYDSVKDITRSHYREVKTRLIRKTFDDALSDIKDGSVDILHIDGLHTFEAVKHDYETWSPKVKNNGIILFHDINIGDYGVWELWNNLKEENKDYSFIEFQHNAGLGVLIKSGNELVNILDDSFISTLIHYYKGIANANYKIYEFIDELLSENNELNNKLKKYIATAQEYKSKYLSQG